MRDAMAVDRVPWRRLESGSQVSEPVNLRPVKQSGAVILREPRQFAERPRRARADSDVQIVHQGMHWAERPNTCPYSKSADSETRGKRDRLVVPERRCV